MIAPVKSALIVIVSDRAASSVRLLYVFIAVMMFALRLKHLKTQINCKFCLLRVKAAGGERAFLALAEKLSPFSFALRSPGENSLTRSTHFIICWRTHQSGRVEEEIVCCVHETEADRRRAIINQSMSLMSR